MFVCKQVFKVSQLLLLLWVSCCCCCESVIVVVVSVYARDLWRSALFHSLFDTFSFYWLWIYGTIIIIFQHFRWISRIFQQKEKKTIFKRIIKNNSTGDLRQSTLSPLKWFSSKEECQRILHTPSLEDLKDLSLYKGWISC